MTWLVSRVMQVLVVTSCTGWKAVTSRSELTLEDFDDPDKLAAREAQLSGLLRPASVMYTGRQHVAAMRGVDAIRAALGSQSVDVAIVSAGYGVVGETRPIAPYNVTFSGMPAAAIRERGVRLGVPAAVRELLPGHDVVFLLLGSDYLTAVEPPVPPSNDQRLVYFAKLAELRVTPDSVVVPAGLAETRRYREGFVALKGKMMEMIGAAVARDGSRFCIKLRPTRRRRPLLLCWTRKLVGHESPGRHRPVLRADGVSVFFLRRPASAS